MSGSAPSPAPRLGSTLDSRSRPAFLDVPLVMRCYVSVCVLAALVLPFALRDLGRVETQNPVLATVFCLVGVSVLNVEIGRLVEGGRRSDSHRPHKALSAWAFCSALLLPTPYLLPVVFLSYAHARWRGMRVPLWKWVGSASFVTLSALAAAATAVLVHDDPNLMRADGGWGLASVTAAAAVFLVVETVLFLGSAYLNDAEDEVWLRHTLASSSFYLTEGCVLLMGGLSAAVWTAGAWFLVLLIPVYALAQLAALNEPLRMRAETDEKTGLLRFESWRRLAAAEKRRCQEKGHPWSVAFADLDHFKAYNDTWGHLTGDTALRAVAGMLRSQLRSGDLVGRFGGEEFCLFLPDTGTEEAGAVAERLRASIADGPLPEARSTLTISIGVVTFLPNGDEVQFVDALTSADRALFEAKLAGRDRVHAREFGDDRGSSAEEPSIRTRGD